MFKHLITLTFCALTFNVNAQQTFKSSKQIIYNFLENTTNTNNDYFKFEFYKPASVAGEHGSLVVYLYDNEISNLDIIYVNKKVFKTEIKTTYYINNPGATYNVLEISKFINGYKFSKKYNYVISFSKILNSGNTIAGESYLVVN